MIEEDSVEVRSPGTVARLVRRLPFTLAFMTAMVLGFTVASATVPGGIDAASARFGLTIHALAQGELWRVLTATVLASAPLKVGEQLFFIAGMIGIFEFLHGTRRAFAVYWVSDIAAKLLMVPLFLGPLGSFLQAGVRNVLTTPDVGMSGGGMALLAGSLHRFAGRYRTAAFLASFVLLVVKYVVWPQPVSDLLHLISFLLGWGMAMAAHRR